MLVYGISESGQGWAGIVPIGWRGRAAWRGRGFVGSGPSFSAVLVDTGLGTWWPWFRSLGMGMDDGWALRTGTDDGLRTGADDGLRTGADDGLRTGAVDGLRTGAVDGLRTGAADG
eukprot:scaffold21222_cov140-Isochrysis_galbana.AAC.1